MLSKENLEITRITNLGDQLYRKHVEINIYKITYFFYYNLCVSLDKVSETTQLLKYRLISFC